MVNESIRCPADGCEYETGVHAASIVAALLNAHTAAAHTHQHGAPATRQPKVERPSLADDLEEEQWNVFEQSWNIFVRANRVSDENKAVQLYSCCRLSSEYVTISWILCFWTLQGQSNVPIMSR